MAYARPSVDGGNESEEGKHVTVPDPGLGLGGDGRLKVGYGHHLRTQAPMQTKSTRHLVLTAVGFCVSLDSFYQVLMLLPRLEQAQAVRYQDNQGAASIGINKEEAKSIFPCSP